MSEAEFNEWIILASIEPWGDYRADLRSGVAARGVAAAWVKDTKLDWFMPNFDPDKMDKPMDPEAIWAVVQQIFPPEEAS